MSRLGWRPRPSADTFGAGRKQVTGGPGPTHGWQHPGDLSLCSWGRGNIREDMRFFATFCDIAVTVAIYCAQAARLRRH